MLELDFIERNHGEWGEMILIPDSRKKGAWKGLVYLQPHTHFSLLPAEIGRRSEEGAARHWISHPTMPQHSREGLIRRLDEQQNAQTAAPRIPSIYQEMNATTLAVGVDTAGIHVLIRQCNGHLNCSLLHTKGTYNWQTFENGHSSPSQPLRSEVPRKVTQEYEQVREAITHAFSGEALDSTNRWHELPELLHIWTRLRMRQHNAAHHHRQAHVKALGSLQNELLNLSASQVSPLPSITSTYLTPRPSGPNPKENTP